MSVINRPDFDAIQLPEGKSKFIHLCWLLHNKCNHKCSYCSEINWGGSFKDLSLESCKSFVRQARDHFNDRRLMVSFTGGEPTLWPEFSELVRWLKEDVNAVVMMTSNGTRHASYFKETAKYYDWISFSYHPEFTRDEKLIENIKACSPFTNLTVRVMFPPNSELFAKSKQFLSLLAAVQQRGELPGFLKVESVPISLGFGTEYTSPAKYSAEQEKVLHDSIREFNTEKLDSDDMPISQLRAFHRSDPTKERLFEPNDLIAREKTNFFGWKCDIGLEQLFIDHLGKVVRAGCRVGGVVGHLNTGVFKFPTKAVYCPKRYCHCITDILTTKHSPEWMEQIEGEGPKIGEKFGTHLRSVHYTWMTDVTKFENERISEVSVASGSVLTKLRPFASIMLWYLAIKIPGFIYTRIFLYLYARIYRGLIRVYYSRIFWKPYFFFRYQYRKRILKIKSP